MHQIVSLIQNYLHKHTFCCFVMYLYMQGTYQDILGLTLYILLKVFDGKVQSYYKQVCPHLSRVQHRIHHARV